MKLLVLAANYPHAGHPSAATFNERCVDVLRTLCDGVEVLVPRPYAPPLISALVSRWKIYAGIPSYEVRNGIPVYRPACPQMPRVGRAFWVDQGAFLWCLRVASKMHRGVRFDAILSFDLLGAGGLAWRLGQALGIPAGGWAVGSDVRVPVSSSQGRVVIRAIEHLDIVFYQSHELLDKAASFLGMSPDQMSRHRHLVLPRGIPMPPVLPRSTIRNRVRKAWGLTDDQVLVLSIGRLYRQKGVFELLDAVSLAVAKDARITCVLVGSSPAFDETFGVQKKLDETLGLSDHVRLLPACHPGKVWDYLCAADIFAFTSHSEGMPNSLLEAMAMGVPAVAFAIPPVSEIEAGTGAPVLVPPFDVGRFSEAIRHLATLPDRRVRVGVQGGNRVLNHFMVQKNMAIALDRLSVLAQKP